MAQLRCVVHYLSHILAIHALMPESKSDECAMDQVSQVLWWCISDLFSWCAVITASAETGLHEEALKAQSYPEYFQRNGAMAQSSLGPTQSNMGCRPSGCGLRVSMLPIPLRKASVPKADRPMDLNIKLGWVHHVLMFDDVSLRGQCPRGSPEAVAMWSQDCLCNP
jgi:hypothetical protein